MTTNESLHSGGCSCGYVKYQIKSQPLIVHCCHCSLCQTQTGSAFAVNVLMQRDDVELIQGEVKEVVTPSPSGKGQIIARCPICMVAVWSNYYFRGLRERIRFIRGGTLDEPSAFPPNVHIYTETRQTWYSIPDDQLIVKDFYDIKEVWCSDSYSKLEIMFEDLKRSTTKP